MKPLISITAPLARELYPVADAVLGAIGSAYLDVSFSITREGGPHDVEWGFDEETLGRAPFYDDLIVHFAHRLSGGTHSFYVRSDYGHEKVTFTVGEAVTIPPPALDPPSGSGLTL